MKYKIEFSVSTTNDKYSIEGVDKYCNFSEDTSEIVLNQFIWDKIYPKLLDLKSNQIKNVDMLFSSNKSEDKFHYHTNNLNDYGFIEKKIK
ncbi:MAG: hypothetical protein Q4E60_04905 [Bacteroidales bacterium]|nr:hypothetical protein [Bacteroidales bacterium]